MLKIILVTFLLLFSIIVGLFPAASYSPHNKILNYFGYEMEIHYVYYILAGSFFYICAAFLAQQQQIDHLWK